MGECVLILNTGQLCTRAVVTTSSQVNKDNLARLGPSVNISGTGAFVPTTTPEGQDKDLLPLCSNRN